MFPLLKMRHRLGQLKQFLGTESFGVDETRKDVGCDVI